MLSTSRMTTLKIQWKEDEMLISAWLNVSTDPMVGTDQKRKIFWSQIHNYCVEFNADKKRGNCM
ncbi:hypothetical protein Ahy_A09g043501 [Arachis hypogaea]|uniref:Uncharacterized protein n=1 Tax=Arachis hypogaea TaxID=3818 RepID=A0A445BIG1_ARAHY|nr:hypothetical protein Ahy_A09g043501 [Arachis hypogaea]